MTDQKLIEKRKAITDEMDRLEPNDVTRFKELLDEQVAVEQEIFEAGMLDETNFRPITQEQARHLLRQ